MKSIKILKLLLLLTVTTISIAKDLLFSSNSFNRVQQQISEIENLIEKVGRDRIGSLYFQKLRESQVGLAQLKAEPVKNKGNWDKLNQMYFAIEGILDPENIALKAGYLDRVKGTGNGIIRGIVRDAVTGEVLTGYQVRLYDSTGNFITSDNIDNTGRYIFTNIVAGQYALVVYASTYNGYIYTAYPNTPCPGGLGSGCQISDLTLVDLAANEVLDNIDVSILSVPVISGQLVDSVGGAVVRYANVKLYDSLGAYIANSNADEFGQYQIAVPLAGDYYVSVEHSSYQLQMYDGVICTQVCDFSAGDPISLNYNQHLSNIGFSLHKNANISGSLVDAVTSEALNYATIFIINDSGQIEISTSLQSSFYWSLSVPLGEYSIVAEKNYDNYLATKHQGFSCLSARISSCDYVPENVIQHAMIDTEDIVLTMEVGAEISGVITDNNSQPIEGVAVLVYYASDHQLVELPYTAYTNENGEFVTNHLGNGDFYLVASKDSHITQLYNNVPCAISSDCDFNLGTVITISNLSDVNNVDLQLTGKSSISGRVVDFNNNPIESRLIKVRDELLNDKEYSYTNSNGEYQINNIEAGTYQLYVLGGNDYFSENFDNIKCLDYYCEGDGFTPLVLDDTHLDIDFQLSGQGIVRFDLISNSSTPTVGGTIYVVDSSGNNAGSFNVYNQMSLPEGDYYFYYQSFFNHNYLQLFVPKVYGGNSCFDNCDATTGTLVHISDDTEQVLTLNLDEYFYFNVTATPDNNAYLRIYEENNSEHYQLNINSQSKIYISNIGNKRLKISKQGFYSQVYNGIDCIDSACDISQGDLITPQLNSSVTVNFNITPLASLSGVVTDENNIPMPGREVRLSSEINPVYNSMYQMTNQNGEYSFDAIPLGDYYLRVDAIDNYNDPGRYATTYYDGIACDENDCSSLLIAPITFNANAHLINYDIQMIKRGSISGEGIQNVFREELPSSIRIYKVNGSSFSSVDVEYIEAGNLHLIYLPEGEYKLVGSQQYQNLKSAYPGTECLVGGNDCIALADSLFVTNGNNTHFNFFTIHQYGVVKIVVKDAISNSPVDNEKIVLYKSGQSTGQEYSHSSQDDEFEINVSDSGLYRAFIYEEYNNQSQYIAQLYNGIDCLEGLGVDCSISQGQEFTIENDTIYTINASLKPRPKLKVSFVDNVSNKIILSKLRVYDNNFNIVYQGFTSNFGLSHYIDYLKPDSYYAIAEPRLTSAYNATGYPSSHCDSWSLINSCDASLMTFELIGASGAIEEVNIRTNLLKGISGYITDVNTGEPLENIIIDFWNNSGYHTSTETSSYNGGFSFESYGGDYYISTDTNNDYINEVFRDVSCVSAAILGDCDVTLGELINIPSNNTSPIVVNIELENPNLVFTNGFE